MALTKAQQAEVDKAVQAALKTAVTAASKPHLVDDLRKTWRKSAEHKAAQIKRLIIGMGSVLAIQIGGDILAHKDPFAALHTGRDLLYFLGPIAFVAWRQQHPAMTASQVDSAPGATIVPAQLDSPPVDPIPLPVPDDMPVEDPPS